MRRIHWPAVLTFGITICGVLGDPHIIGYLPGKLGLAVAAIGAALQTLTKSAIPPKDD
jgi:hypothetical protein